MASLSLSNPEIVRAILQTAGMGRDAQFMDPATEADVRTIIRAGLRCAYFPIVGEYAYQWRWLEKKASFPIVAVYETGMIGVSGGTITLTAGMFPAWAADGFISVDGHVLFVTALDDDTPATVATTTNTQLSVIPGTAFKLYRYRYPLPADFSEWIGGVVYADGTNSRTLSKSSEAEIALRYAVGQGTNSRTTHYDITWTPDADAAHIILWPVPAPDAFIRGIYLSQPDDNLPDDLTDPGSVVQVTPIYADVFIEAILAAAEAYNGDTEGVHAKRYQGALMRAIAHDKAAGGAYDFSRPVSSPYGCGQVLPIDFTDALL